MSAAFCRSTSAALARSSRSFDSASSALAVQIVLDLVEPAERPRISLMSAIERAAEARTSTKVSSISRMIMRIILAGSSDRSRSSVMFAAKMSRARLNTGPLNQVAIGASRGGRRLFHFHQPRRADREPGLRGFRVQALTRTCRGLASACAGPTAAPIATVLIASARGDGDQRAGEMRLRRHLKTPFFSPLLCCGPMPSYYSRCRANPAKLPKMGESKLRLGDFRQPRLGGISPTVGGNIRHLPARRGGEV